MNFIFEYLIESALAMGLVWLVYKLFLEKLTFFSWNRTYLLLGLAASLALPLLSIPITWADSLPVKTLISPGPTFPEAQSLDSTSTAGFSDWGVGESVFACWVSVSAVLFFRLAFSVIALYRKIHQAEKIFHNGLSIALDPSFSPSSFFGYVLLPKESLKSAGLEQIITHESSHIRLAHSLDVMLVQILKSVFWFNPFLYLLEKSLKEVHEYQADSEVVETCEAIAYSRLLVESICISKTDFTPSFNQFQTKKRIVMMNKPKSNAFEKRRFLIALPLILTMLVLFSCQMAGNEKQLAGTWTGSDFIVEIPDGSNLDDGVIEGGRSLHVDGKLVLNEDNTYEIQNPNGAVNGKGVWERIGKIFLTTDEQGNVVEYEVLKLDESTLVTEHSFSIETPNGVVSGNIVLTYEK